MPPESNVCPEITTSTTSRSSSRESSLFLVELLENENENDLQAIFANSKLIKMITSKDDEIRHLSLTNEIQGYSTTQLLQECQVLDLFWRRQSSTNLYETVRALLFLYAIHRFHLPRSSQTPLPEHFHNIPYEGYQNLLNRDFKSAIHVFLQVHQQQPSKAISSALAKAYYELGFQTLANQVRLSVKEHPGNAWMFSVKEPKDHPQSIIDLSEGGGVLRETTPVRMDLSHCGWSDIFFLGMDFPNGARVLNISIDLAVQGRHDTPIPPIETYLETIERPVLKLTSLDLQQSVELTHICQVFEFGKDYLGLLKAGMIASGIVPPGLEHSQASLQELFDKINQGKGLHLTTKVNDIPKGSRLAVSTNLLGSIISLGMRASGQTKSQVGSLLEEERRLVAARAILGEWLGGSGGGWQDSGGVWPGIKLIEGVPPTPSDPEFGTSRGRLLPLHRQLQEHEASALLIQKLQDSLILVHGGMAQNCGPILEMVTEKYLLRESEEWKARQQALNALDQILLAFQTLDIQELAKLTTHNFFDLLQTIVPWASNLYTETLVERVRERFAPDEFYGFWMLGGCSGGGMGFIFAPNVKKRALVIMREIMLQTKREMETALPFAMDPVVYDFSINHDGTKGEWWSHAVPAIKTGAISSSNEKTDRHSQNHHYQTLDRVLHELGFDHDSHKKIRADYRTGKIGLKQNRLPLDTKLENVSPNDIVCANQVVTPSFHQLGIDTIVQGKIGVVTLAAGIGSRWTQGAGCVKALHPFCKINGKFRSFVEVHLAKSRKASLGQTPIPHVLTTSHLTQGPLDSYLEANQNHGYPKELLYTSHGKSIGLRLIPTIRDLKFAWEETQQQQLDEQAQKVKESVCEALMGWAKSNEAGDYRDNLPLQCLHPVGHYYEIPNLILSGTLAQMLLDRPQLEYLMLHNIDTVGANVDPGLLGWFVSTKSTLAFEVIPREIQDVGGGLAQVNGKPRILEGLALPREEDEFEFSYYNSMTTWIHIDKLLHKFGLTRDQILDTSQTSLVATKLHEFSNRLPTYVTLKDVKKRWGHGQEDVLPTAQFEKLWSDMSSLENMDCQYVVVPRNRGAQLKDPAQLDGWLRDGSCAHLETLCSFEHQ